jgi:CDP-diacylglycerol--glycerol-3-phosphate 3-phosphatidyltransferase
MKYAPWILISLRAILPAVIWAIAHFNLSGWIAALCIFIAALSDVYDGKIARKLNISTPLLRRTDSIVDIFFLVSTITIFCMYHDTFTAAIFGAILLMLIMSVSGHIIALIRFRRSAAVHSKLLKVYAVFVYVGFFFAWISGDLSPWIFIALIMGVIAESERHWILIKSKTEPIDIAGIQNINKG